MTGFSSTAADSSTGGDLSSAQSSGRRRHSIAAGASVSGDQYSPTLETSGMRATGASAPRTSRRISAQSSVLPPAPRIKQRIRVTFDRCIDDSKQANDFSADFFLRNNSLARVRDSLADLWDVRSKREEQFSELINMMQGVFANRAVEEFTSEQIDALSSAFGRLRDEPAFNDELANDVTTDLLKGGIDVFREIA